MESFPKFLRSENPHRFKDSAFPPFKVEHRYKGVYERAGFDVNLGGGSQDSKSIHSKSSARHRYPTPPKSTSPTSTMSSPLSPMFNPHKGYQTAASTPNISLQQQPFSQSRKNSLPQSQQAPYKSQHKPYGYGGYASGKNPYPQAPQTAPATGSFPDMNRSAPHLRSEYSDSANANQPQSANPYASTQATQSSDPPAHMASPDSYKERAYATRARDQRPPSDDNFDFSPNSNMSAAKNFKNLHLDLNNENQDIDSLSESENEGNTLSPKNDSFNDTNNTSVGPENYNREHSTSSSVQSTKKFDPRQKRHNRSVSGTTSPISQKNRLSSALDDLKRDAGVNKTSGPPALPSSSPSQIGLAKFDSNAGVAGVPYPVNELPYSATNSPDPAQNANQFHNGQQTSGANLTTDYQRFLGGEDTKMNRTSQLSMVSSIISKDSMYEEEDDEVEKELERQLETLKMAGNSSNINVTHGSRSNSIDNNSTDAYQRQPAPIPVFNIVDADSESLKTPVNASFPIPTITTTSPEHSIKAASADEYPNGGSDSTKSDSENMEDMDDASSTASLESVKPLSFRHSHIPPLDRRVADLAHQDAPYPIAQSQAPRNVTFNNVLVGTTPGANRPVNFNDSSPDSNDALDMDDVKPLSPKNHQVEEELKGINFRLAEPTEQTYEIQPPSPRKPEPSTNGLPYPVDTPPMRNSVQSTDTFMNEERQFPPGEGPCRKCGLEVLPNARGPQRSIYSKTGELSGQWHRGCFSCNQDGCSIAFNKHVQCYAYNDRPYCNHHYHHLNDTICEHCALGIEGECIENEIGQKWHLQCLSCHKCHNTIKTDYYLINGHIICENDALRIINGGEAYNDENGNLIAGGGLSTHDKIEKRRTRLLFVE